MIDIPKFLSQELTLTTQQVTAALELRADGGTIPFIARYRKERTGSMDETQLRTLFDRFDYLLELEERKATILNSIDEQKKLTPKLRKSIEACLSKTELEDLYLPYKPKKRTRATIAKEKGLEPFAEWIKSKNTAEAKRVNLEKEAEKYLSKKLEVKTVQEAIAGASDILAEEISEKAEYRQYLREYFLQEGIFVSVIDEKKFPAGSTKYEMYRDYKVRVKDIQPHNMLALRRGEAEEIVSFTLSFDELSVQRYLEEQEIQSSLDSIKTFYAAMLKDAFERLMKTTIIGEVRLAKKELADIESIKTFEANLRELLLASPAGMKPTLGVDPGFRTGCKVSVMDETGKFLEYTALFPHTSGNAEREKAKKIIAKLIEKYSIELIAIGNGTAGRETDEFIAEVLKGMNRKPVKVMVNESGASVYSASETARDEFPDLDITVRGAISIGRRLMDPLAELVKIDPKSIGVGQYQHDVDQKLLKKKLEETVQSCVNYVGVDLNTASKELLSYVAGINSSLAKNIVDYRNEHGAFESRNELMEVSKFGPKAFEQSAGFLRIRSGKNPLDASAVHPESYPIVEKMLTDLRLSFDEAVKDSSALDRIEIKKYVTKTVGEPTLRDILSELKKPGRDPRAEFKYAAFKEGIKELSDVSPGMELEGIITNVANFGAFVDIGVHQDGLIHVSQLADRFVEDPKTVVKVGQIVKVRVLEVNEQLKRISLTMKSSAGTAPHSRKKEEAKPFVEKNYTLEDLRTKFGRKTEETKTEKKSLR
ncbi:MAG: RNA-binding transcriptional accessory protein [Bacteroidetes bacterium]|nr:RNA-binding transcriptional accessory protein [Bacteroidota bacterium]